MRLLAYLRTLLLAVALRCFDAVYWTAPWVAPVYCAVLDPLLSWLLPQQFTKVTGFCSGRGTDYTALARFSLLWNWPYYSPQTLDLRFFFELISAGATPKNQPPQFVQFVWTAAAASRPTASTPAPALQSAVIEASSLRRGRC